MRVPAGWLCTIVAAAGLPFALAAGCGSSGDGSNSGKPSSTSSSTSASQTTSTAGGAGGIGQGGAGGVAQGGAGGVAQGGSGGMAATTGAGGAGATTGAGGSTSATTTSATTGAGGADAGGDGAVPIVKCLNQVYQCGDGIDNDNDGLVDSADPDCLGACDNTESSYYGGIPGQPGPPCDVDCYFDSNSGSGDDDCYWNHKCDPNEQTPPGHPEPAATCPYDPNANISGTPETCSQLYQQQSAACQSFCGPITPNGCDCFGCCELPAGSGKYVWLGSEINGAGSCTADAVGDPSKCQPCEPVAGCLNTCKTCELCIGKDQLPPECYPDGGADGGVDGGGTQECPPGVQACGLPGQPPCPDTAYCVTGCCQPHL